MTKRVDYLILLESTPILILMLPTSFSALHHQQGKKQLFNDIKLDYVIMIFHVQSNFSVVITDKFKTV